jgi:hypothetical protein
MLFFGQEIQSDRLPWFYIPAWIAITTPPLYIALFAIGLTGMISQVRQPKALLQPTGQHALILLGSIGLPLAAVILLKSTLYDGWRQMYFIYPPMLLVALWGLDSVLRRFAGRYFWQKTILGLALALVGIAPVMVWMIRSHPYQNVYFNRLAGPDLRMVQSRFLVDYWGLSYREGLAYLLEIDPSESLPVYVETEAGVRSAALFSAEEQRRLHFVKEINQAKYYLGNYYYERSYPFHHRIYAVEVDHTSILDVFLLDEEETK